MMKCGGTNIKRSLMGLYDQAFDDGHAHNTIVKPEKYLNKHKITSVRNPFSWYVSLYYYNKPPNPEPLYKKDSDKSKWDNFSTFIRHLFDEQFQVAHTVPFELASKLNVGPFTAHFLKMTSRKIDGSMTDTHVYKNNCFIDHFISLENVIEDLKMVVRGMGDPKKSENISDGFMDQFTKKQTGHDHYSSYYDEETVSLVQSKDRLIFDLFGYSFEEK